MPSRTSSAAANVLLLLVSTAVVLGILEGLARFALSRGGKEDAAQALYTEYDPHLGWRKKPGARATYRRREYTVEVVINRLGLRDPERRYEADPGVFRILALGDSFLEGYTVPLADTVSQVLERELDEPGCRVEVLNAGTAAYSTDQEYLFYREEGRRFGPQLVLVFFYYNDVYGNGVANYFGLPKPLLVARGQALEISNDPVPRSPPRVKGETPAQSIPGSALVLWTRDRLRHGAPRIYNAFARLHLWPPLQPSEPPEDMRVYKRKEIERVEAAWEKTALILAALSREVSSSKARLALVYIPSRFEVNDAAWDLTRVAYGIDDEKWERDRVRKRLEAIAESQGLPLLDLTPTLQSVEKGLLGGPYYPNDHHWNAKGHRSAALGVADFLRREGFLPRCSSGAHRR